MAISKRAREARLDALFDWATDHDLAAVALGHTRDDQAETVLMRLARGTGVDGLAGMSPVRSLNADECEAPWLVRPLLHLDRAALRGWLVARGIGWIEDPTNADPTYERVRARRALDALAPLGITAASLSATADRLQGERVVLRETAARHLGASVALGPAGELMVDPKAIVRVDPTLCERVLATCHYVLTGDALPPRGRTLRRVTALASDVLHRGAGDAVAVSAKVIALAHRGALAFCRDPNSAEPSVPFVSLARWDERVALAEDDGALAGYGWGELGALREDGQRGLARTRHVAGRFGTAAMLGEADWSRRLAGWWRAPALARKTTPTIRDGQGRPLVLLLADGPLPVAHEGKGLVTLVPVSGARHLAAERLRRAMVGA